MSDAMTMINQAAGQLEPVVLDGDEVRGKSESRAFSVTAEQLAAYAGATGDLRADRISGEAVGPAFGFAPLTPLLFEVVTRVVGADPSPTGVVHTHQSFTVREPIRAGDELTVRAQVADLRNGPFGAVVKVAAQTTRADGAVLNDQLVTALVVGSTCVNPVLDPAFDEVAEPQAVRKPPTGTVTLAVARDLTARYASASGDDNPIHLDPAYARNAGFPGVIVHGMCTMAMAGNALEAKYPQFPTASSFGVEWARPVFPGDRLTVRYEELPLETGVRLRFEVINRKQRTVMRGGELVLRP
jgi:acyl dehydratase